MSRLDAAIDDVLARTEAVGDAIGRKAEWTSSYITALPDSAFACTDKNGRHYPHHDKSGKLDLPHLRNALSRVNQAGNAACGKEHLMAHAREAGIGQKAEPIKAEQLSGTKWRVLAIPYGGPLTAEAIAKLGAKRPDNGVGYDLDGEFFSPNTDIKPDWFDRRPLVWHHNLDKTMEADPVLGTQEDLETPSAEGWWTTLWLNRSHQYFAQVDELLRAGKVFGSSGSLPNFVKTDRKTGEILVWPYIEQTLTPTPSNLFSRVVPAKAVDHFDEAGIGLSPAVRGLLTDLDSPSADLQSDLPGSGGGDVAMRRREELLNRVTARLEQ